ncbi:MAG: hypothetical protein PHW50_02615 [Patescibacteria group bacterium]|nr:hypothetical protein [Patescibacteria group bacterium]
MIDLPWQEKNKKTNDPANPDLNSSAASAGVDPNSNAPSPVPAPMTDPQAVSASPEPNNDAGSVEDPFEQGGLPAENPVSVNSAPGDNIGQPPMPESTDQTLMSPPVIPTEPVASVPPAAPVEATVPSADNLVPALPTNPVTEDNLGAEASNLEGQVVPVVNNQQPEATQAPTAPADPNIPNPEESQQIDNMFQPQETQEQGEDDVTGLPSGSLAAGSPDISNVPVAPNDGQQNSNNVASPDENIYTAPPVQDTVNPPAMPDVQPAQPSSTADGAMPATTATPTPDSAPVFPPAEPEAGSVVEPPVDQLDIPQQQTQNPSSTPPAQNQGWQ